MELPLIIPTHTKISHISFSFLFFFPWFPRVTFHPNKLFISTIIFLIKGLIYFLNILIFHSMLSYFMDAVLLNLSEDIDGRAVFPFTFSSLLEFCLFWDYTSPMLYVGIPVPRSWLYLDVS